MIKFHLSPLLAYLIPPSVFPLSILLLFSSCFSFFSSSPFSFLTYHFFLLLLLLRVVNEHQYNKMTHSNLSLVFRPTFRHAHTLNLWPLVQELVGNCAVHCRIIDVLLQKRPWINIISKRERGDMEGWIRSWERVFWIFILYFYFYIFQRWYPTRCD